MKNKLVLILCLIANTLFAQYQNTVWCFGDSAGIDFNSGTATPIFSVVKGKGTSASVCDSAGNLLFYGYSRTDLPVNERGKILNASHQIMANGDSIICDVTYRDMIIIPVPGSSNLLYVFTISLGALNPGGIYKAIIDKTLQGGLGEVIQKNQRFSFFNPIDCIIAIRHGNGRDWWMVTKLNNYPSANNQYYSFRISPAGISSPIIQNIGTQYAGNLAALKFSPSGDKLMLATGIGSIEMFDFDRCTGMLSNHINIDNNIFSQLPAAPPPLFGAEFSPNGRFLYVSNTDNVIMVNPPFDTTSLYPFKCYQYDLLAPNITASKTLVFTDSIPISRGVMQLAPDGRIYLASLSRGNVPYEDTVYNFHNQRLSYIENPNMQGAACGYNSFGFYLGGVGRSYWGLPNQLDYQLGALTGSPCDTITAINNLQVTENNAIINVTYIPTWGKLFVNAEKLKGPNAVLTIYDAAGKQVYTTARRLSPLGAGGSTGGYFTHEVNCSAFFNGMYILSLQTEKEVLVKRFVKE